MPQIEKHLTDVGLFTSQKKSELSERDAALEILKEDPNSSLGWRIILALCSDAEAAPIIRRSHEEDVPLKNILPNEFCDPILAEAAAWNKPEDDENEDEMQAIRLTSYEGAKGMSAQYVFLVGLHAGDLPRNSENITDIEICRFLVGLTRTKKQCSLLLTRRFGQDRKTPSPFLDWISRTRFNSRTINADYWR